MAETQKVIIPVDFSDNMNKIIDYGMSVADKLGAQVLFFHAVNNFQGYDLMVHTAFISMTKDIEKQAEKQLAELVDAYKQRENGVGGRVGVGDAAHEIIKYAKEEKATMIIIGTHGFKGLDKVLIGSTADQVMKKAPCPVLVFNPFR